MAPQLAPTTYRWRCSLPDSTVVTQYRLDKVGRKWCRQDDITLSDRQVGRERTPTRRSERLLRAGCLRAEARRSGGSGVPLPWSFDHSRQAVGSPAPRSQRHLNPRVTGRLRQQDRPAPRKTRLPGGGRGRDEHAVRGQPVEHVADVHHPGERERLGLRPPEGRIWQGYRVMTVQLFPHLIRGARPASHPLAGLPGHSRQPEQVQFGWLAGSSPVSWSRC